MLHNLFYSVKFFLWLKDESKIIGREIFQVIYYGHPLIF